MQNIMWLCYVLVYLSQMSVKKLVHLLFWWIPFPPDCWTLMLFDSWCFGCLSHILLLNTTIAKLKTSQRDIKSCVIFCRNKKNKPLNTLDWQMFCVSPMAAAVWGIFAFMAKNKYCKGGRNVNRFVCLFVFVLLQPIWKLQCFRWTQWQARSSQASSSWASWVFASSSSP